MVQHLGFRAAFDVFAIIAAAGAALFVAKMPETRSSEPTPALGPAQRMH